MAQRLQRSLKYEYEVYVEQEIENYKFSLSRHAILRIGDEAVANLRDRTQPEFDELVLCSEVDRIVRGRLRIPTYPTWRKRRIKLLAQYRRPEHWGLAADAPLVREIVPLADTRVLVAGVRREGPVLYLAAHGCQVTALEDNEEAVERVVTAAGQVGLMSFIHGQPIGLGAWAPDAPLNAVVVSPAAFHGLSPEQRARVIDLLKGATLDGGVHLVETLAAGESAVTVDELRARYRGWDVTLASDDSGTFLARKVA
ncbi:MAG TPA: hypothetical protein VF981_09025 [Gemmatimonadaceae bacterium]